MVFDLLRLDGRDLHALPLAERRERLQGLVTDGVLAGTWQVPAAYDDGAMLLRRDPRSRAWRGSSASASPRATSSAPARRTG